MEVPKRSSNVHNLSMIRKYEPYKYERLGRAIEQFVCMGLKGRYNTRIKKAAHKHNVTVALLKHALEKYYGYFERPINVSFFPHPSGAVVVETYQAAMFE